MGMIAFLGVLYQIALLVLIIIVIVTFFKMARNIEELVSEVKQSNQHMYQIRKHLKYQGIKKELFKHEGGHKHESSYYRIKRRRI